MQATALPVDQQGRTGCQQQHRRTGTDQGGNAQGPGHDRAVGRGAATGRENPGNPRRVQSSHIRRTDFIHHQHIRLVGLGQGFDTTELRQHSPADIPQIRRAFGQQGILQRLLLTGSRLDHGHPAGLGAFALLETGFDVVTQFRVVEHFLMGNENFPDGLGLAALDQSFNVRTHQVQGLLQALTLNQRGLAAQRVLELRQHLDMGRADGDSRCGGDGLELAAGTRRHQGHQYFFRCRACGTDRRQWLDFLAKAFFHRRQERGQGIGGNARFSDKFQYLGASGTEAEQLAQAFDRHGATGTVDDTHTDITVETLRQLRQDLRRPGMQPMGIGQGNPRARPIGRQLAAQHFEHRPAAGGAAQFVTTAFNQQRTQAFKQSLVRCAETGQAEQAAQGLAEVAHRFVRGDEGQARTLDRLLAVQPPEAVAQGQGFHLLQHGGKTIADTIGLAQQARTAPDQFFEIIRGHPQADHLCIQRQLLRCALQQLEQRFSGTGATQGLAQIGFTEGPGQQLQQAQVLVGTCSDTDGQVDDLAVAPVHTFGKLQQAHPGGEHLVAGFRRAVGNRNTLAEKGRALGFTRLQTRQVTLGHQAVRHQSVREQLQGCRFVHGRLAHGNLLYGELEHAFLLFSVIGTLGIVLNESA